MCKSPFVHCVALQYQIKKGERADVAVGQHIDRNCSSDPTKRKQKVFTNRCCKLGCKRKRADERLNVANVTVTSASLTDIHRIMSASPKGGRCLKPGFAALKRSL
ncbi:AN1-type zinc finger protein 2A [Pristimantis euphronides]